MSVQAQSRTINNKNLKAYNNDKNNRLNKSL